MIRTVSFFLILLCMLQPMNSLAQRNYITTAIEQAGANELSLTSLYPRATDRNAWLQLPLDTRYAQIRKAQQHLNHQWPALPAHLFLEFARSGDRGKYESVFFARRAALASLVVAESIEYQGRFLPDIVNGIWAICEETFWGVPAHLYLQKKGPGLPDVNEPVIDLFAAETASLLAWTSYLLKSSLDSITPMINERIKTEVQRRFLEPGLKRNDFWWMGFGERIPNNWDPWICSNWITAVLVLEDDPQRRNAAVKKIGECLDHFLNHYPEDGGCDEGTSYWDRAGGSLFDCLLLLHAASNGRIELFSNALIKNMGTYLYKAQINKEYFINFADGPMRVRVSPALVYNYGKYTGSAELRAMGAKAARDQGVFKGNVSGYLNRQLLTMFSLAEMVKADTTYSLPAEFFLPQLQVFAAREKPGTERGLYVAAKGGHNDESHNHNDIGNFICYYNGSPLLVDAGVGNYNAKTFSSQRYEIWTMQSAYHNTATINGIMQKEGKQFAAAQVQYKAEKEKVNFYLDISGAYPKEAGVKKWTRAIELNRAKSQLKIADKYELQFVKDTSYLTLMTPYPVKTEKGKLLLSVGEEQVQVAFDSAKLRPEIETVRIDDSRLKQAWGNQLYRIKMIVLSKKMSNELNLTVSALK